MGEMEIFRLTAPGKGAYRIEAFVLLHERPAPSEFAPEIQDVTIRTERHKAFCRARLHILTSRVCAVAVNFQVNIDDAEVDFDFEATSGPSRLHSISVDLPVRDRIAATIKAREASGAAASRTVQFSTSKPEPPETDEVMVPIELIHSAASDFAGLPLLFGLPLAKGALYDPESCFIQAGAERIPASAEVAATWTDGSARWLRLRSQAPSRLAESGRLTLTVHINSGLPRQTLDHDARHEQIPLSPGGPAL